MQKLLSKSLASNGNSIASRFWQTASSESKRAVADFQTFGISFTLDVFDDVIAHALTALAPVFKRFYCGSYGSLVRSHRSEEAANVYFISAALIQSAWRGKKARNKLSQKRSR